MYGREDLPGIKEGAETALDDITELISILDQRGDLDPRLVTLLKIQYVIPTIQSQRSTIKMLERLMNGEEEFTGYEQLYAVPIDGKKIRDSILSQIEEALRFEYFALPNDINERISALLPNFSDEERQQFSL